MTPEFENIAAVICDEEKGAVTAAIASRMTKVSEMPDGPVRARIYAAAVAIAGAELCAELDTPESAAKQLRRIADRIEATGKPVQ